MPLRLFPATADWFRAHRLSGTSLKIAGAFVGGIAFSGVVAASWSASWSAMESPSQARMAQAVPQEVKSDAPSSPGTATTAKASEGDKPTSVAQSARQVPCDRQSWPYIERRCRDDEAPAAKQQQQQKIRIISPDRRGPALHEARTRSTTGVGDTGTNAEEPRQTPVRSASAGVSVAPAAQPDTAAEQKIADASSHSVPMPPVKPRRTEDRTGVGPSLPSAASVQPAATHDEQAPKTATASANATASASADSEASKHEAPSASQRRADARHADETAKRRPRRWSHRRVEARGPGRRVTVERTYVLPNGRRVRVRESYRTVQTPELSRSEASHNRRPYGYYRVMPRRLVVQD